MALLSLIFNRPTRAQVGAMQLDASLSENHQRNATISQSPIEDGSNIADHVTVDPIRLSITGLISDSPLSILNSIVGAGLGTITSQVGDALGGIGRAAAAAGLGSVASLATGNPRKPEDSFKYLEELYDNRVPFTVITALRKYDDMVIKSLTVPRNASVGKGLQFTMELEQVIIVQSSITTVPAFQLNGDAANRGQSTGKLGKQAAKQATEQSASKGSLLLQGFQKVGFLN